MSPEAKRHPFEAKAWPTMEERLRDSLLNPENLYVNWAGQRLPLDGFSNHALALGMTGSGKSNLVRMFMQSLFPVLRPGERRIAEHGRMPPFPLRYRGVVWDPKLNYVPFFHRMGLTHNGRDDGYVIIANPLDQRCCAWDIAGDLTDEFYVDCFVEAIAPLPGDRDYKGDSSEFFKQMLNNAFQDIVNGLVERARRSNAWWDLHDFVQACTNVDYREQVIRTTPDGEDHWRTSFARGERLAESCLATIYARARSLRLTAWLWRLAKSRFSMNKWSTQGGLLLLGAPMGRRKAFAPINSLMAQYAMQNCLDVEGEDVEDFSWFFIDEASSVGRFENLLDGMKLGRDKGVRIFIADQDKASIVEAFNKERATSIFNQCDSKALLRLGSFEELDDAAKLLGFEEQDSPSHTTQPGGATSHTHKQERKYRIPPEQFEQLRTAHDYGGAFDGHFITCGEAHEKLGMEAHEVTAAMPYQLHELPAALRATEPPGFVPYEPIPPRQRWGDEDLKRLGLTPRKTSVSLNWRAFNPFRKAKE